MIHVVWNEAECQAAWGEGRSSYAGYLFEILDYLGFSHDRWTPDRWLSRQPPGLTIVIGRAPGDAWHQACAAYCEQGNALLAVGETYGLESLLGVRMSGSVLEGRIEWGSAELSEGLRGSFHFWGGAGLQPQTDGVELLGTLVRLGRTGATAAAFALSVIDAGQGAAACLGIDLAKTFCLIQQGISVVRDGFPSPDGTAAIQDGVLKTDDAGVLDWEYDRESSGSAGSPYFLHPVVDEWRLLFQRLLMRLFRKCRIPAGQVWFWPDGLTAIGHISHDTDGHSAERARKMLALLREADVRSTWCVLMPGYDAEVRREIVEEGHEIALHYNALGTEIPCASWSEEHFRRQLSMLKEQFPGQPVLSNKNHYLRWEGDVQFYRWCERAGIKVEQSQGGTKQGNKGFAFGTCHPFRPVGAAHEQNRPFDLISLPTLAWDPPMPARCTTEEALALLDRSRDVFGVAHFLFHPGALRAGGDQDPIAETFPELIRQGRERGMAWWTAEQIWQWVELRRRIRVSAETTTDGTVRVNVRSAQAVRGVTLVFTLPGEGRSCAIVSGDGIVRSFDQMNRFGPASLQLVADLPAGETVLAIR